MTDRYFALTVVLDKDVRSDDAEHLIHAIQMLRGVLCVKPHVTDPETYSARELARRELVEKLWAILK